MLLDISPPAYYFAHFEEVVEITTMCKNITETVKVKDYGATFEKIRLLPAIAPKEEFDKGLWVEEIGFDWKYGYAFIFIRSDFEKYHNSSIEEKQVIMASLILEALLRLGKKSRSKLNYKSLIIDVFNCLDEKIKNQLLEEGYHLPKISSQLK